MKTLLKSWLFLLFALPLCAEFPFPPSNYEWVELCDLTDEGERAHIFTHREGDAFESFAHISFDKLAAHYDDEDNIISAKAAVAELIGIFLENDGISHFPNHKVYAFPIENGLIAWEYFDGKHDLFHGYVRVAEQEDSIDIFTFFTTAELNAHHHETWTQFLHAL